jgi:hypothetical protein
LLQHGGTNLAGNDPKMYKSQCQRRQNQVLKRIEKDFAVAFQQCINQVEPGDVSRWIQPVV